MFEGVAGTTAVTLTAKRTAAAAPIPAWSLRPRAASKRPAGARAGSPRRPAGRLPAALPRRGLRKMRRPARTCSSAPCSGLAKPCHAAVSVAAHQRRAQQHDHQQDQRQEAEGEELLGAGVEEVGGGDDDRSKHRQGDEVEQRLGDQGAEQHREGLAHAADPPRQRHRPRRLAQARGQGRRHQHPDHRRRGDVAAAHRAGTAAPRARSSTRRRRGRRARAPSVRRRRGPR